MPHRNIKTNLEIFDTVKYRLEFWSKRFDTPIGKLATEFLSVGMNFMTVGFKKTNPELLKEEQKYIEAVRWDNRLPFEEAWKYASLEEDNPLPLPKTIRKGVKKGYKEVKKIGNW